MSDIKRYGVWDKPPREDLVTYADHEAAIEQVLADAKARIEGLKFAANVVIRDSSARDYARDYNRAIDDCLAALTQPQTEKEA